MAAPAKALADGETFIGGMKTSGMSGSMQRVWAWAKEDAGVASEVPRGTLIVLCLCLREILEGLAVCTVAACSKGERVWWLSTLGRKEEWTRD